MIERIAKHQQAAAHPLAGAAELGVIEGRHAAVTPRDGVGHVAYRRLAEAVALGQRAYDRCVGIGGNRHGANLGN